MTYNTNIKLYMYIYQTYSNFNKDFYMIHILSTCSTNVLDGKPLVNGSTIIKSVPICSNDTFYLWTYFFTDKYFNSMCLAPLGYLSFLDKKATTKSLNKPPYTRK